MATLTQAERTDRAVAVRGSSQLGFRLRQIATNLGVTFLGIVVMLVFLMPLGYMLSTAFKQDSQLTDTHAPLWPAEKSV
jgi:ABC-type glycerol-3-phosphate transport system permease component